MTSASFFLNQLLNQQLGAGATFGVRLLVVGHMRLDVTERAQTEVGG